jgi:hypothetical protein
MRWEHVWWGWCRNCDSVKIDENGLGCTRYVVLMYRSIIVSSNFCTDCLEMRRWQKWSASNAQLDIHGWAS